LNKSLFDTHGNSSPAKALTSQGVDRWLPWALAARTERDVPRPHAPSVVTMRGLITVSSRTCKESRAGWTAGWALQPEPPGRKARKTRLHESVRERWNQIGYEGLSPGALPLAALPLAALPRTPAPALAALLGNE
jgi:hypothetical protein